MDLCVGAVVRGATRDGRLHRRSAECIARKSCSYTAPGWTRSKKRSAPASDARGSISRPPPPHFISKPRYTVSGENSRQLRRRTEAPVNVGVGVAAGPSSVADGPGRSDAAVAAIRRVVRVDRGTASAHEVTSCLCRDHACGGRDRSKKRGALVASWKRSRRVSRRMCWARWPRMHKEQSNWQKATLKQLSAPCVGLGRFGSALRYRILRHGFAC